MTVNQLPGRILIARSQLRTLPGLVGRCVAPAKRDECVKELTKMIETVIRKIDAVVVPGSKK